MRKGQHRRPGEISDEQYIRLTVIFIIVTLVLLFLRMIGMGVLGLETFFTQAHPVFSIGSIILFVFLIVVHLYLRRTLREKREEYEKAKDLLYRRAGRDYEEEDDED